MSTTESLFSLELVADSLKIPIPVVCRFPAIAFRLLDFPTLVIHHVEHELVDNIKDKIAMVPHTDLPPQFTELKDRNGEFVIKKGKSCLYKISADTLYAHLNQAPLYVMIIDTFPDVPKLIGSCSVPLNVTMSKVYSDVQHKGLTVPSVHGEKGQYAVYNLMGTEVGQLTLGHRLLSLGASLLSHIPDQSITKPKQPDAVSTNRDENDKMVEHTVVKTADVILQDLEGLDENLNVAISDCNQINDVSEQPHAYNKTVTTAISTQTEDKQTKKRERRILHESDVYVNNVYCPPPLFYNSTAERSPLHVHSNLTPVTRDISSEAEDDNEVSQRDSIPSPTEIQYWGIDNIQLKQFRKEAEDRAQQTHQHHQSKIDKYQSNGDKVMSAHAHSNSTTRQFGLPPHLVKNLPILNALLGELCLLPYNQETIDDVRGEMIKDKVSQPHLETYRTHPGKTEERLQVKPSREPIAPSVQFVTTPQRGHQVHRHEHGRSCRACSNGQAEGVPKNKGWIRQVPEYGAKKTKLTYGMTNTQRLRLARSNPELLKTIEKQKENMEVNQIKRKTAADENINTVDAEVETQLQINEKHDVSRKPVPTPRLSKQLTQDSLQLTDGLVSPGLPMYGEQQIPAIIHDQEPVVPKTMLAQIQQSQLRADSVMSNSQSLHSKKSIEIYLPSASVQSDNESMATSRYSSDFTDGEEEQKDSIHDDSIRSNSRDVSRKANVKDTHRVGNFSHMAHSIALESQSKIIPDMSVDSLNLQQYNPKYSDSEESNQYSNDFDEERSMNSKSYHSEYSSNSQRSQKTQESHKTQESQKSLESHRSKISQRSQISQKSNFKVPNLLPPKPCKSPTLAPSRRTSSINKPTQSKSETDSSVQSTPTRPKPGHIVIEKPEYSLDDEPVSPQPKASHRQTKVVRNTRASLRRPTSVNTDSVSSYIPSDEDDMVVSLDTSRLNESMDKINRK